MEKKLFLGSNTPDGFVGYFADVVRMWDLKRLFILKGGSGVGKNTFIRKFAEHFKNIYALQNSSVILNEVKDLSSTTKNNFNAGRKTLHSVQGDTGKGSANELNIVYIYCSADPESLDGVIIENIGIGIIDGTAPHVVDPKYPGVVDEIVDLGVCIDRGKLDIDRGWLDRVYEKKSASYKQAYKHLARAREWHLEIERHYGLAVDFGRVDKIFEEVVSKL